MLVILCAISMIFVFVSTSFAQELRIIKIRGKVLVREQEVKPWRKAQEGEFLFDHYELMTKRRSECTISFSEKFDKALTIKQNSQVKVVDVVAGNLELPKGRIFSLIEGVENPETFQIRTPFAISGPRGTGMSVESGEETSVRCFEGEVYVKGLDEEGNVVSEKDIVQDTGIHISESGEATEPFALTKKDKKEWKRFRDVVKDLIGKPIGKVLSVAGGLADGAAESIIEDDAENPFNR